jgi:hypothetical protein
MGSRNWQLLRDLEIARDEKNTEQIARFSELVEQSQQACEHPAEFKKVGTCAQDTETKNRGLVQKGDQVVFCLACSRILRHTRRT